ncbi:beta-lactamase/transpeptidase-like protein [Phascolomyces articulosus]|uniref:Beta-lactamase/transpeptidase-like protein n=1 Tax=Phascolomyces articulosus TaxID=60185 RepID=A0AAD5KEI7_9FUNG|nr:beta-lactamase/transpeptidase-like protein [Phascolomyces articulosus]
MTTETLDGPQKTISFRHPVTTHQNLLSSNINKRTTTLFKCATIAFLLLCIAGKRYFNQGPFIPLTCSLFGYACERRYDVPFRGFVHDDYVLAQEAFKNNFYIGEEVGAAVAVYVDGQLVVDMQGGWQNKEDLVPYTEDTLQLVFSCTKALGSIVVAQFVEKGLLSYDEKISTYWPEFGQGKKENVTLGDLMQHAGGVGYLDNSFTTTDAEDPERFSKILAAQPHNFEGVRKRSYHATTRGWFVNEILRRVANTTVHDVMMNELNEKYDIEWNLKPYQQAYDDRIAVMYRGNLFIEAVRGIQILGPTSLIQRLFSMDRIVRKTLASKYYDMSGYVPSGVIDLRYRRIEAPGFSGFTNARSIAKLAAMMANGGKAIVPDEPDLLNPKTYALATQPIPLEWDYFIQRWMPSVHGGWGIFDYLETDGVHFVGWTGVGGSTFWWNQEYNIGFGYCMNAMPDLNSPDERSISILRAVVKQVLKKKMDLTL